MSLFLIVLAVGCFVVGVYPQWSNWVDPRHGHEVHERRHGLWFSPLYKEVFGVQTMDGKDYRLPQGVFLLSWSSLVLLVALGSLEILRWRRTGSAGRRGRESIKPFLFDGLTFVSSIAAVVLFCHALSMTGIGYAWDAGWFGKAEVLLTFFGCPGFLLVPLFLTLAFLWRGHPPSHEKWDIKDAGAEPSASADRPRE